MRHLLDPWCLMHMPEEARTAHGQEVFVIWQLAIGSSLRSAAVELDINATMKSTMIRLEIIFLSICDDDGDGGDDIRVCFLVYVCMCVSHLE